MKRLLGGLGVFLALAISLSPAQKNELGLSLGALLPSSPGAVATITPQSTTSVNFGAGMLLEANYARTLSTHPFFALQVEVPLLAVPSESVSSKPASEVPRNFASLFITPSLRVRLFPSGKLSPWGSIGGGYANYAESTTLQNGAANRFAHGMSTGALQYGVGADYKLGVLFLPLSLRGEVRNVYAGYPSLNLRRDGSGQNTPAVTGGFVIHF